MKTMKFYFIPILLLFTCTLFAQLERSYNPLLTINYSDNTQGQSNRQIGNYKVKGSSYLFNDTFTTTVFYNGSFFAGNKATYDTYFQKVENIDNASQMSVFNLADVDSFKVFYTDKETGIVYNKIFINSKLVDSAKNTFLEKVAEGAKISLYKSYTCTLEDYVATYATTTGYKQFKQVTEYYYLTPETKKLVKIKLTEKELKKAFGGQANSLFSDSFSDDPENNAVNIINTLNAKN
jgi:hypothetical protein